MSSSLPAATFHASGGGMPRAAAAMASSTLLPTITASLRNEFVPLLQTLENLNSFSGATYMIEVVFALVRFDAFLNREERCLFVRAFNALIAHLLKEQRCLEALHRQLEENRNYLEGLVERCAILEEMAEAKAWEEYMKHGAGHDGGGCGVASGTVQGNPTFALAYPPLTQRNAAANGGGEGGSDSNVAWSESTAPYSLHNSFARGWNPTGTTPGPMNLSFAANNASMTEKQAGLQRAFRSSVRRRVEHGLSQGSWTVPANLSELSQYPSSDVLPRGNASFTAPLATTTAAAAAAAAAAEGDMARAFPGHLRRHQSGYSLPPLLPTESGSQGSASHLCSGTTRMPPRRATAQGTACREGAGGGSAQRTPAPLPYFPSPPPPPLWDADPQVCRDASSGSFARSVTTPAAATAATVEALWEAAFWSLLNGAAAPADVELLYGLLNATQRVAVPAASAGKHGRLQGGSHNPESKHRGTAAGGAGDPHVSAAMSSSVPGGGSSSPSHHNARGLTGRQPHQLQHQLLSPSPCDERRQPVGLQGSRPLRFPTPHTARSVLASVGSGTAEPVHWHTWFTMLAVLSVLTEGFLFGGIAAEGAEEEATAAAQRDGKESRERLRRLLQDGEDDGAELTLFDDDVPTTPAVSLISDASLLNAGEVSGGEGRDGKERRVSPPLLEPSPEALSLLQRVICAPLRNFKVGFDNVVVAAPVLAARAAGPQAPPPHPTATASQSLNPHGITRAGTATTSLVAMGSAGGEDASVDRPQHQRQQQQPPRRLGQPRSMADLTTSSAFDAESSSLPPSNLARSTMANKNGSGGSPSPDSFAFPVVPGILAEGGEEKIRPVDVVLHAIITALEVQLEAAAEAALAQTDEEEGEGHDSEVAAADGSAQGPVSDNTATACEASGGADAATSFTSHRQQQQQQPRQGRRVDIASPPYLGVPNLSFASVQSASGAAGSSAHITTLLQKSFSSVAAQGSSKAATASACSMNTTASSQGNPVTTNEGGEREDVDAAAAAADGEPPVLLSLPAIMKAELSMMLERVTASLGPVASMVEQLKSEASLLLFRVVSTVLDWLIPAVYLVNHRVWLFYRAWICDLYALMQREGLMGRFTAILDQDRPDTGDDAEEASLSEERHRSGGSDGPRTPPPEPPSTPTAAANDVAGRRAAATTAALDLHARRKGRKAAKRKGKREQALPAVSSTAAAPRRRSSAKGSHASQPHIASASRSQDGPSRNSRTPTSLTAETPLCREPVAHEEGGEDGAEGTKNVEAAARRAEQGGSGGGNLSNARSAPESEHMIDVVVPGGEDSDGDAEEASTGGQDSRNQSCSASGTAAVSARADPFAMILPGCNVHIIAVLGSSRQGNRSISSGKNATVSTATLAGVSSNASTAASPTFSSSAAVVVVAAGDEERPRDDSASPPRDVQQAVLITRESWGGPERPSLTYRNVAAHIPPQLQLQRMAREELCRLQLRQYQQHQHSPSRHLPHPALRLVPEVAAGVRAAQALLDEGTYVPLPRSFMLTRLVAATVRGMDPDAARSLLAPFIATATHPRQRPPQRGSHARVQNAQGGDDPFVPTRALSDSSGAAGVDRGGGYDTKSDKPMNADEVKEIRSPATMLRSTTTVLSPAGSVPTGFPQVLDHADRRHARERDDRSGAATAGPATGREGGSQSGKAKGARASASTAVERRKTATPAAAAAAAKSGGGAGAGVRAPVGEIVRAAPSTIDNQKPASNILTTRQPPATSAAHVERPALVHHHRFRYPVVEGVDDVGQLYVNTLHEAEGMLSPHDPLRAALVQSMVNFYLHELHDPLRAVTLLEDYLDEVGEEQVQLPALQSVLVLGDVGAMAGNGTAAAGSAAGADSAVGMGATPPLNARQPAAATTSAFSVTSVRRSQQRQPPPLPPPAVVPASRSSRSVLGGGAGEAILPQVPMVIPSWGTREEEAQFIHVIGVLRSLQEMLRAQYVS